jgi:hypothetical protein
MVRSSEFDVLGVQTMFRNQEGGELMVLVGNSNPDI